MRRRRERREGEFQKGKREEGGKRREGGERKGRGREGER